jgi:hypothetical protein
MIAVLAIGDCELLVLRRCGGRTKQLEAVFHTEMQRIDGNAQAPLQVARVDDRVDVNFDESITIDVIEKGSAVHCMSAYEGDILVQGSDGLFDNLFLDEIVDIVNEYLKPNNPHGAFVPVRPDVLEQISRRIVAECHRKTDPGPGGMMRDAPIGKGGKVDDTCCVVGEVIEWTDQHTEVWGRAQRKRNGRHAGAFCGVKDPSQAAAAASGLGMGLLQGLGLFKCGIEGGSDYGSECGTECGSDLNVSEYAVSEYEEDLSGGASRCEGVSRKTGQGHIAPLRPQGPTRSARRYQ